MTDSNERPDNARTPEIDDLEISPETVQNLTPQQAEQVKGGLIAKNVAPGGTDLTLVACTAGCPRG